MRGCFFLKEEEETATIPHAKLRFTYRQMEISDTCILWGLARLHTLRGIRVWTGSPGNVLSHHFIISLTSAQDENRLSRCDFQFSFFFLQRLCYKRIQAQRRKSPRRFGVHLDSLLNENKSCDREIKKINKYNEDAWYDSTLTFTGATCFQFWRASNNPQQLATKVSPRSEGAVFTQIDKSHSDGFFIKISFIAQKAFVSQPAWPYLPSKSALAPKLQLHSNINFIHNSMISGVTRPRCFQFSVNPESPGRKLWSKKQHNNNKHTVCFLLEVRGQERSDGVLQTVHLRYSGGEKAARCLEAEWLRWVCARACVERDALCQEERAQPPLTHPSTPLSLLSSPHKFRQRALNQQHPLQSDPRSLQSQQSRGVQPLSCGTLTRKKRLHVWLRYTLWKMP